MILWLLSTHFICISGFVVPYISRLALTDVSVILHEFVCHVAQSIFRGTFIQLRITLIFTESAESEPLKYIQNLLGLCPRYLFLLTQCCCWKPFKKSLIIHGVNFCIRKKTWASYMKLVTGNKLALWFNHQLHILNSQAVKKKKREMLNADIHSLTITPTSAQLGW